MKRLTVPAVLAALLALAVAAPAGAAEKTITMKGYPAPGTPKSLNKVFVTKFGSDKAKRVLVLIPGTSGGAGDFTLVARRLVKTVPGLAVWAIDRRSQALEDTSVFKQEIAGKATEQQALDYYLGWVGNSKITNHFMPLDPAKYGFAYDWGLNVALNDVRTVVLAAKKGGRKVILGGHSLGGSVTTAYAIWDFKGKPGWKDLSGLVLIDGGLGGKTADTVVPSVADQAAKLAALKASGTPWLNLLGNDPKSPLGGLLTIPGLPYKLDLSFATGAFAELGAIPAWKNPTGISLAQSFALLPAMFKPPIPATNRGQLGYAFDESTSPASLGLIHTRSGQLGANGDWINGEVTPIENVARAFGQEPVNAVEWYFPKRLSFDLSGLAGLEPNATTKAMGLRPKYAKQVKLPIYAIQSSLSKPGGAAKGRLDIGTHAFVAMNKSKLKFVDASAVNSHLDPLLAAPSTSVFLQTVTPWLKKNGR